MEEHDAGGHGVERGPSDGDHAHGPPRGYGPGGHAIPGGLSVSADGLLLAPAETRIRPGDPTEWTFRVLDGAGDAVTDFSDEHGAPAHLIVLRRDLVGFQHRHPSMDEEGTWHVEGLSLPKPGVYRAFLDLARGGRSTTLGHDLLVPGSFEPAPRPDATRRATAEPYRVELLDSDVSAGSEATLAFELRREGSPVDALEPYLGALGHLVVVREGDLAYLHVHPRETDPGSGRVEFGARFPTRGRYRLFLQARPDGELVTVRFDVSIDD